MPMISAQCSVDPGIDVNRVDKLLNTIISVKFNKILNGSVNQS